MRQKNLILRVSVSGGGFMFHEIFWSVVRVLYQFFIMFVAIAGLVVCGKVYYLVLLELVNFLLV